MPQLTGHLPARAFLPYDGLRKLPALATPPSLRVRNGAMTTYNETDFLHRRFEQHALHHPHEIAALCGTQAITYRELNCRANRLARYLRRVTESPASAVGIFIEPCIGTLICLLAALKAERPYIPLDAEATPSQTAGILAATEALILLPSESSLVCLPARRSRAISIESEREILESGSASNLFGSGETERVEPIAFQACSDEQEAIGISHRECLHTIASLRATLGLSQADRFVATMQRDCALAGLWMLAAVVCGARLILAPLQEEQIGDLLRQQIDRSRAAILRATPQIAEALLGAGWHGEGRLRLVHGTDSWPGELLQAFDGMGAEFWQLQGRPGSYQLQRNPGRRND